MDKLRLVGIVQGFAGIGGDVALISAVTSIKSILVGSAAAGAGATRVVVGLPLAAPDYQTGTVGLMEAHCCQSGVLAAVLRLFAYVFDQVGSVRNRRIVPGPQWINKKL